MTLKKLDRINPTRAGAFDLIHASEAAAAIDLEADVGDEIGFVTGEEDAGLGDVEGMTRPRGRFWPPTG